METSLTVTASGKSAVTAAKKTLQTGLRPGQGAREEEEEERSREETRKERRTPKFEKGNTGSE